jgi:PKD repeat protein
VALAALAGCGGGGGGGAPAEPPPAAPVPAPPPPPAANQPPAATFSAPASAVAGSAVLFDARGSTDADGDPLTFSWDFGNGVRGGGARGAHVFDRAGDYTVRLTVNDGRGASAQAERVISVSAGAAPAGFVDSRVSVRNERGLPLAGVSVALADASGGSASATTGADGRATLRTGTGVPLVLRFAKDGHAEQVQRLQVPASDEPGFVQVTLRERAPAVTLPDAAAGGTLAGPDGVRVVFAPGSLVDASGNPATGPVQVAMTPVDVTESPRAFPGRFEGLAGDGQEGLIVSFGVVEVVLRQGGQPLQLAPGRSATLEIPVYARQGLDGQPLQPGDTYPMWSLNPRTGLWVAEATGTVVAAPGTPEGLALRGEVTHFSWWNHDLFTSPPYRPRPKCLVDTNYDGVLEDLSGTGYCWHEAGTQTNWEPRLRQFGATPGGDRRRALSARISNDPPTTPPRQPAFIATAATPAGGGTELLIPPDMDIIFHSYARNGTLFGQTLVRGASGVGEEVVMVLSPVEDATGTVPVTLPWNRVYAMGHVGEVDRFNLVAAAGQTLELQLSRSNASTLSANVVVRGPGGATVASGAMGAEGRTLVIPDAVAGTYTVEVTASGSAPGAYRLQAERWRAAAARVRVRHSPCRWTRPWHCRATAWCAWTSSWPPGRRWPSRPAPPAAACAAPCSSAAPRARSWRRTALSPAGATRCCGWASCSPAPTASRSSTPARRRATCASSAIARRCPSWACPRASAAKTCPAAVPPACCCGRRWPGVSSRSPSTAATAPTA